MDAAEVIPVPPISPVPLARNWFKGVASVRGNLYSVTDFSAFLGGEAAKLSADARLLVLGERFRSGAALLVARSLGLRALGELTPQSVATPMPWVRGQYSDAEGRIWKELDVAELVQREAFLEVSL
jgi:twitching motility protein PilI